MKAFERGTDGWPELMPLAYYTATKPQVKLIRAEIFRLAKQAPDLETMHWYIALDECFENNEFDPDDFKNLQWRSFVLEGKGEPVIALLHMITPVLQAAGCVDSKGKLIQQNIEGQTTQ
jgi:hypothetical protein